MQIVSVCAALVALGATTAAARNITARSDVVRMAFYDGPGTGSGHYDYYLTLNESAFQAFGGADGYSITNVSVDGIQGLKRDDYDIVLFPGGSGNGQASAIGEVGLEAIRTFVAQGGGYLGTCGGAFLALQHAFLYGNPPPPTQEPWDRGHGPVEVEFSPLGLHSLGLNYTHNVTIIYWQGPIVKPDDFPKDIDFFATYRTEIHSLHTNETTGEMINTPAITARDGNATSGRVVLTSPHPEIPRADGTRVPAIYTGELTYVREKQIKQRQITVLLNGEK